MTSGWHRVNQRFCINNISALTKKGAVHFMNKHKISRCAMLLQQERLRRRKELGELGDHIVVYPIITVTTAVATGRPDVRLQLATVVHSLICPTASR